MFSKALWCKPLAATCYSLRPPCDPVNQNVTFGFGLTGKSEAQRLCPTSQSGSKNFGFKYPGVGEDSGTCTNTEFGFRTVMDSLVVLHKEVKVLKLQTTKSVVIDVFLMT